MWGALEPGNSLFANPCNLILTWHRGAKCHKNNSCDRVLEANGAAEVGGQVPDDGREHANDQNGDDEAGPATAVLCGGHTGKQHLPEDRQKVHHIVKAGRQPLLA